MIDELVQQMASGDEESILRGLYSESPILIMNAILQGHVHGIRSEKFLEGVKDQVDNDITLLNIRIGDAAKKVLNSDNEPFLL